MVKARSGPPRRVLVTGSSGLLGGFVVQAFADAGWEVRGIDRNAPPNVRPVEHFTADAADPDAVAAALQDCDALVHLAALPDLSRGPPEQVFAVNVALAEAAIAAAARRGVSRITFASSIAALGFAYADRVRAPDYLPVDEDHPCRIEDHYGLSKRVTEQLFELAHGRRGGTMIGLRLPVIWHPGAFAAHVSRRRDDPVQAAKSMWSYIDGRDAGTAVVLATQASVSGFRLYNIAAALPFGNVPAATLAAQNYPNNAPVPRTDSYDNIFSIARARTDLGFNPVYNWSIKEISADNYTHLKH